MVVTAGIELRGEQLERGLDRLGIKHFSLL
jgi:hypothetical protein